ncbi:hypothetical protein BDR07DRAFT_1292586, partial [Suillus spraguei]
EPTQDLHETSEAETVAAKVKLPTIGHLNVNIKVHRKCLSIFPDFKRLENDKKVRYTVQEYSYGNFSMT